MDSLDGAVAAARTGGPAGEIRVRTSLMSALVALSIDVDVVTSDAEMAARVGPDGRLPHDILIFDEWTLVAPGGRAHPWVSGRESDVFLLAFFGLESTDVGGFAVRPEHVLTAFPNALGVGSTFLGFSVVPKWAPREGQCEAARTAFGGHSDALDVACSERAVADARAAGAPPLPAKKVPGEGVVWGKKRSYFDGGGRVEWLGAAAALAPLHGSFPLSAADGTAIVAAGRSHGHMAKEEWDALLGSASFFVGVGDPLLGPSAVDALGAGAVYIDPFFANVPGVRHDLARWGSQHPFVTMLGEPYSCGARLDQPVELAACVRKALSLDLPPFVPAVLTPVEHMKRVKLIFAPWAADKPASN